MIIIEFWKQIPDYPNYECSNTGKIRSVGRFVRWGGKNKWLPKKELKPSLSTNKYFYVNLYNKGGKRMAVHYVILLTYKRDRIGKEVINHKDGIKTNNNLNNLEYCTQKYNMQHASKKGLLNVSERKKTKKKEYKKEEINIKTVNVSPNDIKKYAYLDLMI